MAFENKTLGELLDDPRISLIAPDAIRNRDLKKEDMWNKTLSQLKEDGIRGDIAFGLDRLYASAETGDWYYPLYTETEIAEDESRRGVNLVRLPAEMPDADRKPFILLIPGGGFVNVWSLISAAAFFIPSYTGFVNRKSRKSWRKPPKGGFHEPHWNCEKLTFQRLTKPAWYDKLILVGKLANVCEKSERIHRERRP